VNCYVGIDPGGSGALALFHPQSRKLQVVDMPTHLITIGTKKRTRVDLHGLAQLLGDWKVYASFAAIEEVHSTPMDGPVGAFAFGEAFGAAKMGLASHGIPYQLVKPQEWKVAFRLIGKDKDESRLRASQILPEHASNWQLKKHDGRAEAVLIALYAATLKGDWK
jgi:crossover junction endodeoxyribonuclease RuvC